MLFDIRGRRGVAGALAALTLAGLVGAPVTARADDPGKGKDGKKEGKGDQIPIVIGPATIVKDPPPSNPPPKKEKK